MTNHSAPKHSIETEDGMSYVLGPVTYLDAYRGWVRELPVRNARGDLVTEVIGR